MTRCTLTFLLCVCASFFLNAQTDSTAVIRFTHTDYSCGNVIQGTVAEHKFHFVNAGNAPLIINVVYQGMYVPDGFRKEPVAPGDSGFVLVRFDTHTKAGAFSKTASVLSNSKGGAVVLHLNGTIITDKKGSLISFDTTTFWFDEIEQGTDVNGTFSFTNTGKGPLVISDIICSCGCLAPNYSKDTVLPGDKGVIKIRFATAGKMGPQDKICTVRSNSREGDVVLHLRGHVKPKCIDPNGPVIKFDSTWYWFDTVYQGSTVDHEFRFTNTGKSPLIISNVTGSSGSVVPSYPKEPIGPGKSATIRVVFNTTGKAGPQQKSVTVTSNACEAVVVLNLKGYVIYTLPPPEQQRGPR